MALNLLLPAPPIPIFSSQPPTPRTTSTTELRFSRWNNANAEKFTQKQRAQQQIEDDIRRTRRFTYATQITQNYNPAPPHPITVNENFKSIGTPSSPSRPSIPGKKSKYSKPPTDHPAFSKPSKVSISRVPQDTPRGVQVSEDGVSYRVPNAPFEFQYSYTETPKVKPLALREPPFVPFGPTTMPRPWTGRAPLSPSKKKLPEFDSFKLPPPHKKGVKPVQSPGPFLAGMGPKYVQSREEILGDPLMEDEIKELVHGCLKTKRQLNMGRDGLTHNMLDNIHAHWKRRRVCKIKCKGVCTVDLDNVRQQLEEKTGGKIIYSRGGALFLFRGRNYNYRNRPRFPLMLWKPVTPVYPRLIQQVPEGLTLEEAREMRKRGRELQAICKLGKNGVYSGLVEHVKEAFKECELVRVDCQGMNGSDYKKIGAKLKDLVPCVLVSFEFEHILMWRGRDWKSSFLKSKDDCMEDRESATDGAIVNHTVADSSIVANEETTELIAQDSLTDDATLETRNASRSSLYSEGVKNRNLGLSSSESEVQYFSATSKDSFVKDACESFTMPDSIRSYDSLVPTVDKRATKNDSVHSSDYESEPTTSSAPKHSAGLAPASDGIARDDLGTSSEGSESLTKIARLCSTCTDEVVVLMKKAVEIGSAVILDDASLDADIVFERSVAFSKAAPPGPVFRNSVKKVLVRKRVKHESSDLEEEDVTNVTEKMTVKKSFMNQRIKDFKEVRLDTLPYGSLGVDELAKLLG